MSKQHDPNKLGHFDAASLLETRLILETAAVKLAAERRTDDDLHELKITQENYTFQALNFDDGVEENIQFHLKIMDASKNILLKSLFMKLVPELLELFYKTRSADNIKYYKAIHEHTEIIGHLEQKNIDSAEASMRMHLA